MAGRFAFRGRHNDGFSRQPSVQQQLADTMFAPPGWAEAPAAGVEQTALPIPHTTIEGEYQAWMRTAEGESVFHLFCKRALEDVESGIRLSGKFLWELVRRQLRVNMNNDFHALVVRDAEAKHPELAGKFEKRKRTAT